jgi:hypothetical protein
MGPLLAGAAALSLALAGCFAPSPASGSYACSDDGQCPSGLTCSVCSRVCVSDPRDDVCTIQVAVPPQTTTDSMNCPAFATCVYEREDLMVQVSAFDASGKPSTYRGSASIASTWGHARPQPLDQANPFGFRVGDGGMAQITIHLDRATPPTGSLSLSARVGKTVGVGIDSIVVDAHPFVADAAPILTPGSATWAQKYVGYPAVDRPPSGGYRMYVSGLNNFVLDPKQRATVGLATSADGTSGWSLETQPLFSVPGVNLFAPSTLRDADGQLHLFVTAIGDGMPAAIWASQSSDGLSFPPLTLLLDSSSCAFCGQGIAYPWSLLAPGRDAHEWLLFFNIPPPAMPDPSQPFSDVALARSSNGGANWSFSTVPLPGTSMVAGLNLIGLSRVIYDEQSDVYRMWYARAQQPMAGQQADFCKTDVGYATSQDGLFFADSRSLALPLANIPWKPPQSTGVYPGAVLSDDKGGYQLFLSPVETFTVLGITFKDICLPDGVGRAIDD